MRGVRAHRGVIALALAAAAGPAEASPATAALSAELEEILRDPELAETAVGVHVRALGDGATLFARDADRLFNPASNMKLLTTAAALWHLGPNHRFRTELRRDPALRGGALDGHLYVKGHGDPTLTGEVLFSIAHEVALAGITEIRGDLVLDTSHFDDVLEGPGWEQEVGDPAYAGPVSAFSTDFGSFAVHAFPGEALDRPARVTLWPDVPSLELQVQATTSGAGTPTRLFVTTARLDRARLRVTVRGQIAADDADGEVERRRVVDPARFAGEALVRMLALRGVALKGEVRRGDLPRRGTVAVATHLSPPLAEIVGTLNRFSNNVVAEQLLKALGAERLGVPGTWAKGTAVLDAFLVELGVTPGTFVLGNGSGLNDVNRLTPSQLTRLLAAMHARFDLGPEFVASLAVAGASGTIRNRFGNTPAAARLRAKTGTLTGVSALSGYVGAADGEVLAFSVMMNEHPGRARAMWRVQDRIGVALARFERGGAATGAAGSR